MCFFRPPTGKWGKPGRDLENVHLGDGKGHGGRAGPGGAGLTLAPPTPVWAKTPPTALEEGGWLAVLQRC